MSSDGQNTSLAPQKKWGEPRTPRACALLPLAAHRGLVAAGALEAVGPGHLVEDVGVRDVAALLEEGVAQVQAHRLAHAEPAVVGGGGEGQRRQGGGGEGGGVEPAEEVGGHLLAQLAHVVGDRGGVERPAVHQLERPAPHVHGQVLAPEAPAPLDHPGQPHVGEGAPDVGVDLEQCHRQTLGTRAGRASEGAGHSSRSCSAPDRRAAPAGWRPTSPGEGPRWPNGARNAAGRAGASASAASTRADSRSLSARRW